jgi:hypothetical protein
MAYLYANEPYQRVDNGVMDGALWGAGIGVAAGGATMGASYMMMKGIPRKAERMRNRLEEQQQTIRQKVSVTNQAFNQRIDNIRSKMSALQTPLSSPGDGFFSRLRNTVIAQMNNNQRRHLERELARSDRQHEKAISRLDKKYDQLLNRFGKYADPNYVETATRNSFYAKHLSGWKGKAGLVGGAALLGSAIGALVDELNN